MSLSDSAWQILISGQIYIGFLIWSRKLPGAGRNRYGKIIGAGVLILLLFFALPLQAATPVLLEKDRGYIPWDGIWISWKTGTGKKQ
ncbi:MAG: hypothetical protein MI863_21340 [Desulfobacterales bacterium]|nr:hypothetical protein [Desulfobacterales bacterium]